MANLQVSCTLEQKLKYDHDKGAHIYIFTFFQSGESGKLYIQAKKMNN